MKKFRYLVEAEMNELGEAQILLALQSSIDDINSDIESYTKQKADTILPLTDMIGRAIGESEADAYDTAANEAIDGVIDALKEAKAKVERQLKILSGEEVAGDELDITDELSGESDMDTDLEPAAPKRSSKVDFTGGRRRR